VIAESGTVTVRDVEVDVLGITCALPVAVVTTTVLFEGSSSKPLPDKVTTPPRGALAGTIESSVTGTVLSLINDLMVSG